MKIYKLVLPDGTTGQTLFDWLKTNKYKLPAIHTAETVVFPARPTVSQHTQEGVDIWNQYTIDLGKAMQLWQNEIDLRAASIQAVAAKLQLDFVMASLQVVGHSHGQNIHGFVADPDPDPDYTFKQAAERVCDVFTKDIYDVHTEIAWGTSNGMMKQYN